MSTSIDTVRVREEPNDSDFSSETSTRNSTSQEQNAARKMLEVSDVDPDRVAAYARATVEEGQPELYFERKGGRTFLVTV